MSSKTDNSNSFQKIISEIKEYVELRLNYLQVSTVEKLTRLISIMFILMISVLFLATVLFYLSMALANALAPLVGLIGSYLIIAGIFLLMLACLLIFRKQLVVNPVLNLLVRLFFESNENDNVNIQSHAKKTESEETIDT